MPLLRVHKIRKFQRIAHEENRRIVADDVPIPLLSVESQRETAHVTLGIGCPALARDRRKP
jgi:hypothetical protein